jgi:hypothetical protein
VSRSEGGSQLHSLSLPPPRPIFVLVRKFQETLLAASRCRLLRCQYLYFCTSKASKLSTSCFCVVACQQSRVWGANICHVQLEALRELRSCQEALSLLALLVQKYCQQSRVWGASICHVQLEALRELRSKTDELLLRCQYLYFCTSKASKLSTCCFIGEVRNSSVAMLLRSAYLCVCHMYVIYTIHVLMS